MTTLKKIFVIALFTFGAASLHAQFSIGAGLSYVGDINNIGIDLRAYYEIDDFWRGEVDFNYILPDDVFGININYWALNFNANYVFDISDEFQAYPLAGFNIFNISVENDLISNLGASDTDIGINLGGGGEYMLSDKIDLFGELKFVLGGVDNIVLMFGAKLNF